MKSENPSRRRPRRSSGSREFQPLYRSVRCGGRSGLARCRRSSKRLRQTGLAKDGIGGVAARNADGYGEVLLRDRAVPDFVAAFALPDEDATRGPQQVTQGPVELRRHLGCGRLGFAQCGDLQE